MVAHPLFRGQSAIRPNQLIRNRHPAGGTLRIATTLGEGTAVAVEIPLTHAPAAVAHGGNRDSRR
ncbi:histidine kinase [Burkholderia arboris]|uniref:Histidine kinase n=1 Tax=Burkholderia arboris TaxID=488730 RepID=A0A9Q9SIK4_9BURK|nr:histidine kinase [Burkholderia arboris]